MWRLSEINSPHTYQLPTHTFGTIGDMYGQVQHTFVTLGFGLFYI